MTMMQVRWIYMRLSYEGWRGTGGCAFLVKMDHE
jgi:hypothetical protein